MRLFYGIALLTLMLGVIFWPAQQVSAQALDTLEVPWSDDGINPLKNSLRNTILGDTLPDGTRNPDRVYKLERGGYYWNTDNISCSGFHLRLVGDTPDPEDEYGIAVVQMVRKETTGPEGKIISGNGSVTLKNIYFIGCDNEGVQTYYQPIEFGGSGQRFVADNCIFERTNFAFMAWTGADNDIFITNCKFRNQIGRPSTQQWEGRGVSIWTDQDTIIVENNTFFLVHSFPFQLEGGAANYVRMNHNTFIHVGRQMCQGSWWKEGYITNNLIVNGFWHGEGWSDINDPNREPDQYTSGMFIIGDLPSKYGPNEGRKILFANMAAYREDVFDTWYADSIRAQPFCGTLTWKDYINEYDAMVVQDTQWVDPGLNTVFDATLYENMISNMNMLRDGEPTPFTDYMWMIPQDQGLDCNVCPSWPLPEDFTYTNTDLQTAATDGLPMGDLNWYPTAKATWEANKDQYVKQIHDMVTAPVFDIVETMEAEDGTLGGDAEVSKFEGFSYFQMDGAGFIQWDFELAAAGQYDLNVWTHMRGNDIRGQRVIVNGVSLHECFGWGEYIWDAVYTGDEPCENPHVGMPINEWTWTLIKQEEIQEANALTLPAGANTIRIEPSWGWQNFAGIDILEAGTENVVKELRAPDASYDIVLPMAGAAPWVPNMFKSVSLNSTGSVTWNVNTPTDGNYLLRVFYQNYGSPVTGQILLDGALATEVTFESDADSLGLDFLSDDFPVTGGTHDVAVATTAETQVKVDYVQYIQKTFLSIKKRPVVPDGYALEQNYPNPFNPTTNINFALGKASNVKLVIYNVLGQKVITLVDKRMNPGAYSVQFDASRFASGIYFYRIEAGEFVSEKKMVLLK
jgi:hypothetical protein